MSVRASVRVRCFAALATTRAVVASFAVSGFLVFFVVISRGMGARSACASSCTKP